MTTPWPRFPGPRRPGPGSPGSVPLSPLPLGLLAPPATPTFPPGYQPGPADFGGWVQRSLGFCAQKIVFRAHQVTSQNLSGGSTLVLDVVDEDPYSGWVPGASNRWIPPWTGWYEVTVTAMIQAGTTAWLSASMAVSGGARFDGDSLQATTGNSCGAQASQYVPLIGGQDYVTPMITPNAAVSTEVIYPGRCSSMEIEFLSE